MALLIAKSMNIVKHAKKLKSRGIQAKDDEKGRGRRKELTEPQLKNLRKQLVKGPRKGQNPLWTTKMVMDYVEKEYGKKYTVRHMRRLLHQLGFSVQKPRPRHYKTDVAQQERFKKTSGRASESTGKEDSRFFVWARASSP